MLYLVGGASRSGKSGLVRKLLAEKKVPYFPLDAVMMACSTRGEFNVYHSHSPERRSKALWPFTQEILNTTSAYIKDYAFEGDYILPGNINAFRKRHPDRDLRAVFLGYAKMAPERKLSDIRKYAASNDWTRLCGDDQLLEHIHAHIAFSVSLKAMCLQEGIAYFDVGDDFSGQLDNAYAYLTQNASPVDPCRSGHSVDSRNIQGPDHRSPSP